MLVAVALTVAATLCWQSLSRDTSAQAQGPEGVTAMPSPPSNAKPGQEGRIQTTTIPMGNYQQVVVLDAERGALAVYHVDAATGRVALRSVRNVYWDLEVAAFNTDDPQPREIRDNILIQRNP
jgi:hypothetical protein